MKSTHPIAAKAGRKPSADVQTIKGDLAPQQGRDRGATSGTENYGGTEKQEPASTQAHPKL